MRKKADQIMRRIPDRHERFAPSMIEKFKFAPPPPSTPSNAAIPNGVASSNQVIKQEPNLVNGTNLLATPSSSTNVIPPSIATEEVSEVKSSIRVGGSDIPFEDRPALERTGEGMGAFASLDEALDELLESFDFNSSSHSHDTRPRSSSNLTLVNGSGKSLLDANQRLNQLIHDDDELAVWKVVNEDLPNGVQHAESISGDEMSIKRSDSPDVLSGDSSKKRKRQVDWYRDSYLSVANGLNFEVDLMIYYHLGNVLDWRNSLNRSEILLKIGGMPWALHHSCPTRSRRLLARRRYRILFISSTAID
jgi:hypothetical protein